jgi:hypothetical protein
MVLRFIVEKIRPGFSVRSRRIGTILARSSGLLSCLFSLDFFNVFQLKTNRYWSGFASLLVIHMKAAIQGSIPAVIVRTSLYYFERGKTGFCCIPGS